MTRVLRSALTSAMLAWASTATAAQLSAPSIVSALPDIKSISPANAAGVLQYCLKHDLVSSSATDGILAPLASKPGVKGSPEFSAGIRGSIISGGKTFALGSANDYLRSQACDQVFRQVKQIK